jgi:hypothetical protein
MQKTINYIIQNKIIFNLNINLYKIIEEVTTLAVLEQIAGLGLQFVRLMECRQVLMRRVVRLMSDQILILS